MATIIIDDKKSPERLKLTEHYDVLTTSYGKMIVNTHDPCLETNLGENEKEIEGLLQFAHGTILDIGANVGSHAINFARQADIVYAFEPHPHTYWNLCGNILINSAYNVTPLQCALGSRDGSTTVWNIDPHRKNTAMGLEVDKPLGHDIPVPMQKIDSLGLENIYFIKIDVEGHEVEVLKGGRETFMSQSPIVFCEMHRPELRDAGIALMSELGYLHHEFIRTEYGQGTTWGYIFWKEGRIVWAVQP